jgi:NAD(P)-dependent dehydrogenase (short-subunit alcohol dehydrogenase family)
MFDFKDKVVLITGAAQGFGPVLANTFAARAAKLALCDINDEGGAETLDLVKAQGADGFYNHADISQESDVEAFVAATVARFGRLDVAVNNASKEISGPTLDLPSEDFGTVIDTNLKGTLAGVTPAMRFRLGPRVFHILAAIDEDERRRWLRCRCEERDL